MCVCMYACMCVFSDKLGSPYEHLVCMPGCLKCVLICTCNVSEATIGNLEAWKACEHLVCVYVWLLICVLMCTYNVGEAAIGNLEAWKAYEHLVCVFLAHLCLLQRLMCNCVSWHEVTIGHLQAWNACEHLVCVFLAHLCLFSSLICNQIYVSWHEATIGHLQAWKAYEHLVGVSDCSFMHVSKSNMFLYTVMMLR
jgi:hypothetical protein